MQRAQIHKAKGFTMVELVVYIGMFALISVVLVNSLMSTIRISNELRAARDINDSAVSVMERLTRDLRGGTQIDLVNSSFGANPGRLTFQTLSASGTAMTVEYYVSTSTLLVKENGVVRGSLLSSRTKIDGLVFYYVSSGATTGVKTELHLRSVRGGISDVDHFYNTTILRGTY